MSNCACNASLKNIGTQGCPSVFQVLRQLIFVSAVDANGDDYKQLQTTIERIAYLEPLFNTATLPKSRMYPSPLIDNVENVKGETQFQEFGSGNRVKIREGFRTITAYIPNGDTELLNRIKSYGCSGLGFYGIDLEGNFIFSNKGNEETAYAYPILIDQNSFDAQLVWATYGETQMIMLTFQVKLSQKDEWLRYIPAEELDWTTDDIYSLVPVYGDSVDVTQTSLEVDLFARNASNQTVPITGLDSADLVLYNVTDSASVTINTVTESTTIPGRYTIGYASQTVADVLRLTIDKDRYTSEDALEDEPFVVA